MPPSPKCPECRVDVQPSWDWCMSCGYDPEGLKPATWTAGSATAAAGGTTTMARPRTPVTASVVEEARPQQISDPDWVPADPRRRLSYVATLGVLAAILIAVAALVFVILMVLHQPVGTTRADALSFGPPVRAALSARASTASR
ncbi:MAG: hypothetical protein ACXWCM_07150 [Acidimicrobiales bacterium]